jgi:ADP-ribosyl-[dinitrogen reductase] hydrolase
VGPLPGYWKERPLHSKIEEIARGSFRHRNPPEIYASGYVGKSLEAALWAFCHSDSSREGCLKAINLGFDADTTGAVYGQLAGAFYGESQLIESFAERLSAMSLAA